MSEEHIVSRRTSLKILGATGAAVVLTGFTPASPEDGLKPAGSGQDQRSVNIPDLAAERMASGFS